MSFAKGNQLAKGKHHKRTANGPKTIWLLQSLASNGVDLQDLLAKSILKASRGDDKAMELAHLLTKLLPHVVNAPKTDSGVLQIDTLVINRYGQGNTLSEGKEGLRLDATGAIEGEVVSEGVLTDGQKAADLTE